MSPTSSSAGQKPTDILAEESICEACSSFFQLVFSRAQIPNRKQHSGSSEEFYDVSIWSPFDKERHEDDSDGESDFYRHHPSIQGLGALPSECFVCCRIEPLRQKRCARIQITMGLLRSHPGYVQVKFGKHHQESIHFFVKSVGANQESNGTC